MCCILQGLTYQGFLFTDGVSTFMYNIYDDMEAFSLSRNSPLIGYVTPDGSSQAHPVSFSRQKRRPDLYFDELTGKICIYIK